MAEIVVMALGLMALIAVATAAVVLHKKPPAPELPEIWRARERWIASGDPRDEEHWKQLLEKMEE